MNPNIIRLTAAALYGKKAQEFDKMKFDRDFFEAVRFLSVFSVKITHFEGGKVIVTPVHALPKPEKTLTFRGYSRESALFFLGIAVNFGLTFNFIDVKGEPLTREQADALSAYVRNILQITTFQNGFKASSLNVYETSGCIAHAPIEFAAGLLLTLPLSAVDSCFGLGDYEGNELLETTYERLVRYNLVDKRRQGVIYVKSARREMLLPKKRQMGRPRKIPTDSEKA